MLYFAVKYVSISRNGPISLLLNRNFQFLSYVSSYLEEWQYTVTLLNRNYITTKKVENRKKSMVIIDHHYLESFI